MIVLAGVDAVARIADRGAVDRDAARQDQRLVARARQLGHAWRQHAVEPLAGLLGGDHQCLAAPTIEAMSNPSADDEQPLDPAAARMVAKVRWLMLISGVTTMVAIAAVHRRHRLSRFQDRGKRGAAADVTALLPKGARIVATAVAEDRIAVTMDVGGAIEIRTFDLRTLKPTGRLRFATEP